jgi:hypothetical protein
MPKLVCTQCTNRTFQTTAHVTQTWEVDEKGEFIDSITTCDEVTARPNLSGDFVFTCNECGAEAKVQELDKLIRAAVCNLLTKGKAQPVLLFDTNQFHGLVADSIHEAIGANRGDGEYKVLYKEVWEAVKEDMEAIREYMTSEMVYWMTLWTENLLGSGDLLKHEHSYRGVEDFMNNAGAL